MLTTLLWVVLSIVGLFIFLSLFLPIFLGLKLEKTDERKDFIFFLAIWSGAIGLEAKSRDDKAGLSPTLFGLRLYTFWISPEIGVEKLTRVARRIPAPRSIKSFRIGKTYEGIGEIVNLLRQLKRPLRRALTVWVKAFSLRRLLFDVEFGTGDPADTGKLCGWLSWLLAFNGRKFHIILRPVFLTTKLNGRMNLNIKIRPYRMVQASLIFLCPLLWMTVKERLPIGHK